MDEQDPGRQAEETTQDVARAVHRGPGPFEHEVRVRGHVLVADEPPEHGGHDRGPDPFDLLASALAACTSMTLRVYAGRKGWDLGDATVAVGWDGEEADGRQRFRVVLELPEELGENRAERLLAVAAKCPTRKALAAGAAFSEHVAPLGHDHIAAGRAS